MVKCEFPCVYEWVERMYGSCFEGAERPQRVDQEGRVVVEARLESWLAEDEVPATLLPILGQFFEEHAPILVATVQALRQRVRASSAKDLAKELPRAIGQTDFVVGGSHGRGKVLMAFDAWKTQRVLDALSPESREWLARTFGPAASAFLALDMSDVRLVKKAGPNRGSTVYLREYCAADGRSHL
jgi:hypothetical protein